jgi:hypothetical protein
MAKADGASSKYEIQVHTESQFSHGGSVGYCVRWTFDRSAPGNLLTLLGRLLSMVGVQRLHIRIEPATLATTV